MGPILSRVQRLTVQHVIGAAVAGACIALALAGGGFEPTAFAAAGLVVWVATLVGLAVGVLPRSEPPLAAVGAGLALAGLVALTALSLAWTTDPGHAFEDVVRALAYLGGFLLVVVTSRRAEARPWLTGVTVGLVAVATLALLARFEPSPFGSPDAHLAEQVPAALGRLTYPIGYWNGLAAAMAAAIVLLAWFAATAGSRLARSACVGAMAPVLLALWMTDSRGGLVAALLAFGVLVAIGPWRAKLVVNLALGTAAGAVLIVFAEQRDELLHNPVTALAGQQGDGMLVIAILVVAATMLGRYGVDPWVQRVRISRTAGRAALIAIAAAAVATAIAIDPVKQFDEFKSRPTGQELAGGSVGLLRGGGSGRYQFWETAVDAFASAPLGGLGASGYTPYWFEHREIPIPATRAHSLLFETLAELGIGGFVLVLGFFGFAAVAGVKRARAPGAIVESGPAVALLAVGFAVSAVDWTWDLPAVFGLTVLAAALLTGPATLAGPEPAGRARPIRGSARNRRRFAGGVGVLVVAWLAICGSGLLVLSAHSLDSSRSAASRGDIQAAVGTADDAIKLQPWAAEPRLQLALVLEQGNDLDGARDAIAEAVDRSPDDYRLRLLAARMDAAASDLNAARAALLEAHRLNPRDPEIIKQVEAAG